MNKQELKTVLAGLTKDQEITVNFRGDKVSQNGDYKVLESKVDRGKMGSRKATLLSLKDNTTEVVLHTRDNDQVLNIVINGTMHGSADENGEPRNYAKDIVRGKELTALFKTFKEGQQVSMKSEVEPTFNGTFTVKASKASRGKFGQQILTLTDGTNTFEVWSYKHSLALTNIEAV